jgi:hypothetical protein
MARNRASTSVPKSLQVTFDAITSLTDAVCRDHLNEEYGDLAQRMTAALCRKRPPPHIRAAPHVGLRDCLCVRPDQLSDRPLNAALHDDG